MEYCPQGSLADHIRNLTNGQATQNTMLEIARGLQYLHTQRSIVHRDLTPDNIMLKDGHAKISDYGLAQVLTTYGHNPTGKIYYMAYEVAVGGYYDFSVDIWSLGVVFL